MIGQKAMGEAITAGYLPMLGIPALHGRTFLRTQNESASEVVLSYALWSRLLEDARSLENP